MGTNQLNTGYEWTKMWVRIDWVRSRNDRFPKLAVHKLTVFSFEALKLWAKIWYIYSLTYLVFFGLSMMYFSYCSDSLIDLSINFLASNIRICAKETNFLSRTEPALRAKTADQWLTLPRFTRSNDGDGVDVMHFRKAARNRLTWRSSREIWENFLSLKVWMKWISFWKVELQARIRTIFNTHLHKSW